jgi:hypothetical protein
MSPSSDDRSTLAALRGLFGPTAKPLAYWRNSAAAFLAVSLPGAGQVRSVVRLNSPETIDVRFDGTVRTEAVSLPVTSLDLEGVRLEDTVVMFHTERNLARSALSFDTGAVTVQTLRFILTGVAPGVWEIWRNGWVVDIGIPVRAGEAVLYFEGRPGSYFIRRLN